MPVHATLDVTGKLATDQVPEGLGGEIGPPGPPGPPGSDSTVPGPQGPPGTTTWAGITDKPITFTPSSHGHAPGEVTGTAVVTNDARLSDARTPVTHDSTKHSVAYETANSNIQAHVTAAHAPSNAQKNSDITKGEIEAVLTGAISSHSHAGGGVDPFMAKLVLSADKPTGANATPVTLGLSFNFEANSKYVIDLYGMVQPAVATTGCAFPIDVSANVTYVAMMTYHQLALAGTLSGSASVGDLAVTANGTSSGMPNATAIHPVMGQGILISGVNAGTATFFFRSETTAVTTCKAGTMIRVMKIA